MCFSIDSDTCEEYHVSFNPEPKKLFLEWHLLSNTSALRCRYMHYLMHAFECICIHGDASADVCIMIGLACGCTSVFSLPDTGDDIEPDPEGRLDV